MRHLKQSLCLLLAALMLMCTGCSDSDIDTALGIADALLGSSSEESAPAGEGEEPEPSTGAAADASASGTRTESDGSSSQTVDIGSSPDSWLDGQELDENGTYSSEEDVALYLYTYGHLPDNYITKKEAKALGWSGGSLEPYAPGKCIGGSRFGNYEGQLPEDHVYYECDIDTLGARKRGAKRIVYSEDCDLVYYTEDHYETFTLLYGEE